MNENILVIGGTSGIARALCHVFSRRHKRLLLAGRDLDELSRTASDLHLRYGIEATVEPFEALAYDRHPAFVERCIRRFPEGLTGVVLCFGHMEDQHHTETHFHAARRTLEINFLSAVSLLIPLANYFERQRAGYIAAVTSVAGDRGRQSNYTYGSSKAALSCYLEGLRNRLHPAGVCVLTIKPGYVDTRMSRGRVNPDSLLLANPETVARDIDKAIRNRQDILYTPFIWSPLMKIIRSIPESLFKRLKL
jgi:short-subunit dehydrogenase